MSHKLSLIDLFSGVGAFGLGLERSGYFEVVAHCEIDPFCRRVLEKHWPDVPCHDDVTTREFIEGEADAICGGFPCQDVSLAGRRAGLSGSRSGLYRELVRAIRMVRPKVALVENVAALLSDGMGTVLGDLAEIGDCIEWDCVPAKALGAPHERDRVWIVAYPNRERRGEEGEFRHRQVEMPSRGTEARPIARDASDASREQVGTPRQSRLNSGLESGSSSEITDADRLRLERAELQREWECERSRISDCASTVAPDTKGVGRREGRTWRPPDSFARVRDEARRNSADPYGARLAFREGLTRDAWEKLSPAERDAFENVGQSIWPNEPALSGVDDGNADWMDRVRATGNQVLPQIPEIIGRAIGEQIASDERAERERQAARTDERQMSLSL